jgi:hypothetical protein
MNMKGGFMRGQNMIDRPLQLISMTEAEESWGGNHMKDKRFPWVSDRSLMMKLSDPDDMPRGRLELALRIRTAPPAPSGKLGHCKPSKTFKAIVEPEREAHRVGEVSWWLDDSRLVSQEDVRRAVFNVRTDKGQAQARAHVLDATRLRLAQIVTGCTYLRFNPEGFAVLYTENGGRVGLLAPMRATVTSLMRAFRHSGELDHG